MASPEMSPQETPPLILRGGPAGSADGRDGRGTAPRPMHAGPGAAPMAHRDDTPRDLLFGLLALQNGLIDQDQLLNAFRAWTRDKGRPLADLLVDQHALDAGDRAAVEALAARHLRKHGGDAEKSLASVPVGRSTREALAQVDDPGVQATV